MLKTPRRVPALRRLGRKTTRVWGVPEKAAVPRSHRGGSARVKCKCANRRDESAKEREASHITPDTSVEYGSRK